MVTPAPPPTGERHGSRVSFGDDSQSYHHSTSSPLDTCMMDGATHHSACSRMQTFPTLEFHVTKTHHKRGWLKQKRLLILSDTNLMNAKPRSNASQPPEVTKTHSLRMMQLIALKSKRSFMLRFEGDHDYFYSSDQALEIVWEVNRRRGAMRAVEKLSGDAATLADRKHLISLFAGGVLDVPHSDRAETEAVEKKMDLIRAIRGKAVDGAKEAFQLRDYYLKCDHDEVVLHVFRQELNECRDVLVRQLLTRQRSFSATFNAKLKGREIPIFEDDSDAVVCAEEALQALIAEPTYGVLWEVFLLDPALKDQQRRFEANRRAMQQQDPIQFGLRSDFAACSFRLAQDHLESLQRTRNPCSMMNIFAVVAKSILLSLNALSEQFSPQRAKATGDEGTHAVAVMESADASAEGSIETAKKALSVSVSADDMLPLFVHLLISARSDDHYIPFYLMRMWIETVGDYNECTERAYYYTMFCSAVEYIFASEDESKVNSSLSGAPDLPVSVQNLDQVIPSDLPPTSPAPSAEVFRQSDSHKGEEVEASQTSRGAKELDSVNLDCSTDSLMLHAEGTTTFPDAAPNNESSIELNVSQKNTNVTTEEADDARDQYQAGCTTEDLYDDDFDG